jgi:hypothetical protein
MKVIDVDPDLLRHHAQAAIHASDQSELHLDAEIKDVVSGVMDTLVAEGPYAWCVPVASSINADGSSEPSLFPDGHIKLPFASTREGILDWYEWIHERFELRGIQTVIELRGEWYTFYEGYSPTVIKATGERTGGDNVALFPSAKGTGITGELVWGRNPINSLGLGATHEPEEPVRSSADLSAARQRLARQLDEYLNALRTGDIEGVLAVFADDVQALIRDYPNETGTLATLDGKEAHRVFYEALFAKYEIVSVDRLQWIGQDWYVFAEVRVVARERDTSGPGRSLAFHTAEYFVPGHDGRFVVRIGHGTDPAPA